MIAPASIRADRRLLGTGVLDGVISIGDNQLPLLVVVRLLPETATHVESAAYDVCGLRRREARETACGDRLRNTPSDRGYRTSSRGDKSSARLRKPPRSSPRRIIVQVDRSGGPAPPPRLGPRNSSRSSASQVARSRARAMSHHRAYRWWIHRMGMPLARRVAIVPTADAGVAMRGGDSVLTAGRRAWTGDRGTRSGIRGAAERIRTVLRGKLDDQPAGASDDPLRCSRSRGA